MCLPETYVFLLDSLRFYGQKICGPEMILFSANYLFFVKTMDSVASSVPQLPDTTRKYVFIWDTAVLYESGLFLPLLALCIGSLVFASDPACSVDTGAYDVASAYVTAWCMNTRSAASFSWYLMLDFVLLCFPTLIFYFIFAPDLGQIASSCESIIEELSKPVDEFNRKAVLLGEDKLKNILDPIKNARIKPSADDCDDYDEENDDNDYYSDSEILEYIDFRKKKTAAQQNNPTPEADLFMYLTNALRLLGFSRRRLMASRWSRFYFIMIILDTLSWLTCSLVLGLHTMPQDYSVTFLCHDVPVVINRTTSTTSSAFACVHPLASAADVARICSAVFLVIALLLRGVRLAFFLGAGLCCSKPRPELPPVAASSPNNSEAKSVQISSDGNDDLEEQSLVDLFPLFYLTNTLDIQHIYSVREASH